jgi:pimeloyl-ACP methyl ester carboxylesterase
VTYVTTSDGVRLYAEDTGSGLPVLFIHEFAADHRTWARQVTELEDEFRCVTYSARGYPPSEVPPEQDRYSYLRQADDAIDVLDALGIERAHVVGLSMGGFCALQLGIRYPGRVSSLLVASAGSGASPAGRAAFLAETGQVAAGFRATGAAAMAAKMAVGPSRIQLRRKDPDAWAEFAGQLAEHSAEGMALTVLGIQQARPSLFDLAGELAGITAPVLVVNGDEDEACLEPGLLLKRTIRTAGLVVVPNSGHPLNLEEPGLFSRVIRTLVGAAEAGTWPVRDPRSLSATMGVADGPGTGTSPGA